MKILVIADPKTTLAFALAGISTQAVQSPAEIPGILQNLDRETTSLVLITEALASENRAVIERLVLEPGGPLILEIPDTAGSQPRRTRAAERIVSLLRR
jgi:vacuolar-type H+-ATPase subunit F/Vma7